MTDLSRQTVERLAAELSAGRDHPDRHAIAATLLALLSELESLRKVPMPEEVEELCETMENYARLEWPEAITLLRRQARALAEAEKCIKAFENVNADLSKGFEEACGERDLAKAALAEAQRELDEIMGTLRATRIVLYPVGLQCATMDRQQAEKLVALAKSKERT